MVAHLMAMANPKKVTKLISIGAPWRKEDLDATRDLLARVTVEGWRDRFRPSYNLYQSLNPRIDFNVLVDNLKYMWLDETDSGGYPDREIQVIQCPLLVVRGDEDHLFPRESATLLAGLVKNASLLNIPFAGHEVHKQQAKIVSEIIYEFLWK